MSETNRITSIPCSIDKDMVRESISKIKKWKDSRTVRCSVGNGKAGEAGVEKT